MSVINKMLQELDRRNATGGVDGELPPRQVKVVAPSAGGHEWFWRCVAVLMLAALAWVGWVAYQLQPSPSLATEQAFMAAEQAKKGRISGGRAPTNVAVAPAPTPAPTPPPAPAPAVVAPAPVMAPPETKPAPPAPSVRETPETLRLAQSIQTPIADRPAPAPAPAPAAVPSPAPAPKPPAAKPATPPKAPAAKSAVDKRERAKPASELAEAQFRRAALLLNQGRVSEAEEQLIGALQADPAHTRARQAYVALLLEQQRSDTARRVLREALAVDPSHPTFALALARILAEQRDYQGALEVMDRAGSVGSNADFLALRGAVLQRLQKHPEAIDAYEGSVRAVPQPGTTWVGYAISLEAVGRKADAANAYRRSLGAGGLTPEVRDYAQARIRALE